MDANRNECAEPRSGQGESDRESPPRVTDRAHESELVYSKQVLTLDEAAEILRVSSSHLMNLIHGRVRGVPPLPHLSIGRRTLILRESLERWLGAAETPGDKTA
jgi:excisionase family DNA binding protein